MPSRKASPRKPEKKPDAAADQRRRTAAAHENAPDARTARAKAYLQAERAREAELEKRGYCF